MAPTVASGPISRTVVRRAKTIRLRISASPSPSAPAAPGPRAGCRSPPHRRETPDARRPAPGPGTGSEARPPCDSIAMNQMKLPSPRLAAAPEVSAMPIGPLQVAGADRAGDHVRTGPKGWWSTMSQVCCRAKLDRLDRAGRAGFRHEDEAAASGRSASASRTRPRCAECPSGAARGSASNVSPSRQTSAATGLPSEAPTISRSCAKDETGVPSTARITSPSSMPDIHRRRVRLHAVHQRRKGKRPLDRHLLPVALQPVVHGGRRRQDIGDRRRRPRGRAWAGPSSDRITVARLQRVGGDGHGLDAAHRRQRRSPRPAP